MSETVFVAHRGYSGIAPENTKEAFSEAVKHGFGGVECDVWELKKGKRELMIMHDESMSRMCGINVRITEMTREELWEYPVIKGKNIEKYGGALPIPSYEDYLDVLSDCKAIPMIEIKSRAPENEEHAISLEGAKRIAGRLYEKRPYGRAVIQSFNLHSLYRIAPFLKPETELFYLVKRADLIKEAALNQYIAKGLTGISAKFTIISSPAIKRIRGHGLKAAIWTVDNKITARKLAKLDHVDYVITNKKVFASI